MREPSPRTLDRLLAGELTRNEERRLAQAALTDPELFDTLTAAAVARHALASEREPEKRSHLVPARRRAPVLAALAAAAGLVFALSYVWRISPSPAPTAPPVTETVSGVATPILLTARLDSAQAQTFRADATSSRPPKDAGVIVRARGDVVEVDLGSLDGLKQGVALQIVRDGSSIGPIAVTTVFRDHARGRPDKGVVAQTGDRVEVDPAVHASARLEHAEALNELGVAQTDRRELSDAARTFESALAFATGPTRVRVTNNLGALAALRGDRAEAERRYRQADALAAASSELAAERQTIAGNLSALRLH
jgi:hypothetical protein